MTEFSANGRETLTQKLQKSECGSITVVKGRELWEHVIKYSLVITSKGLQRHNKKKVDDSERGVGNKLRKVHKVTGQRMGWRRGDKRPCKPSSKSEFTLQITFTEYIYIYI